MDLRVRFVPALAQIPRSDWDLLALPEPQPFLQYNFLKLLETSGAVTPEQGWQPAHFTLWDGPTLVAAAPLYIRSHSWGDFVFDQAFAQAVESAGLAYYPKLVGTIPLNPVPAWKILRSPAVDEQLCWNLFDLGTRDFVKEQNLTGRHLLWTDPKYDSFLFKASAGIPWSRQVYAWENRGYGDFSGFLATFKANQRKNIRKERDKPSSQGLELEFISGTQASSEIFLAMEEFYLKTNDKFGPMAAKFLPSGFFPSLGQECPDLVRFSIARRRGEDVPLAAALVMEKGGRAYGRWWGTHLDLDSLHFNLCYYLPLEAGMKERWALFDPGMGGDHKSRRGFHSGESRSYHWAVNPPVQDLFARYLPLLSRQAQEEIRECNQALPLKTILS